MSEHAKLSPSSSKGWLNCSGRIAMESQFPPSQSQASDDGTAMHLVAKLVLTESHEWPAAIRAIGTSVPVHSEGELTRTVHFTQEMAEMTQDYVDTVRALGRGHTMLVEHRVDFSQYVGVPNQFGTADCIILMPLEAGGFELFVIDLKTGWIRVEPENNTQGMLYALGALAEFDLTHDIKQVRIGIFQPKHGDLSEWAVSMDDLMTFADYAKERALRVEEASAEWTGVEVPGGMPREQWDSKYLLADPTEDTCRFCKAMAVCPAMAAKVERTIGASFEAVSEGNLVAPPQFIGDAGDDDAELATKMAAAGMIEDWLKAVRAEVERRLLMGAAVPGWGLELGREGPRKWTDEEKAEEFLRKNFRLTVEQSYDMKVISPTTAEKLLKTKHKNGKSMLLNKKQWAQLQALIVRSPPSPSVKPAAVIKKPYQVGDQTPPDTFEAVDEESLS